MSTIKFCFEKDPSKTTSLIVNGLVTNGLRVDTGGWEAYVGLGIIRVIRQGDDNLCTTRPYMIRPSYAIKKGWGGGIDKSKKRGEACTCRDLIMVITGIESSRSLVD